MNIYARENHAEIFGYVSIFDKPIVEDYNEYYLYCKRNESFLRFQQKNNGKRDTMILKKSKFFLAILAAVLFVSAFTFNVPEARAATAQTGTVNMQNANLRELPSTASTVLAQMTLGSQVSVQESENAGWYKVAYQELTGYVRADYIDVAVTGLSEPAVIIGDAVMTDQPGSGSTIANLTYNTQVTIIGSYGTYFQITSGTLSGYVPRSSVHKYRVISINLKATMNSSNVNVRSLPSTSGDVLDVMRSGTAVTVQSIQDKWVKVSYSGKEGYIRGDFITYTVPAGSHITTLTQGMKCQAVSQLQIALKNKGFFYPAANGVFGNATRAAVAKFQSTVNLEDDGIAGPQTLLVLLGKTGAMNLWNNYRTEMPVQKTQKSGRVYLEDWFDGMEKMKKMEPFEVIDVRTGIHWNMERFGGWWHADVEVMTKEDTAAMTKAWGGELNPTRRPVWVKIGGKYYAASLMGCAQYRHDRFKRHGRADMPAFQRKQNTRFGTY